MSVFARQFGHPRGPLGRLVGLGMARGNADFSRWVVQQVLASREQPPERAVEVGSGPGVGLQELHKAFPHARLWGIDISSVMLAQAAKRNHAEVQSGLLMLLPGGVSRLLEVAPVDIVMANHVLYFWHDPAVELTQIHHGLRTGGVLALGFQLRQNMPPIAQKRFPTEGHLLYDSIDEVESLLRAAGFPVIDHLAKGPTDAPHGRLILAVA